MWSDLIYDMACEQKGVVDERASHIDGEVFYLANSNGHGFRVMLYDGVYLSKPSENKLQGETPIEKYKKLKDVELDKDDVLIGAYSKCGTHWLWEAIEMLKSGVAVYKKEIKETRMLGQIFKEEVEAIPTPRILNSHLPLRMLPKQLEEKKIKCIQIMRNPKDVCVSFFNHLRNSAPPNAYEGDFQEFTEAFLTGRLFYGSYHHYLLEWQAELADRPELPCLSLYYEDMKKDPVRVIRQVADYLGVDVTDRFCEEVAEACSFQKMKKADNEVKTKPTNMWREGSDGTFYRKGEVGDWKNWFTVAESEKFDRIWNEKMKNSGITFTYSLK